MHSSFLFIVLPYAAPTPNTLTCAPANAAQYATINRRRASAVHRTPAETTPQKGAQQHLVKDSRAHDKQRMASPPSLARLCTHTNPYQVSFAPSRRSGASNELSPRAHLALSFANNLTPPTYPLQLVVLIVEFSRLSGAHLLAEELIRLVELLLETGKRHDGCSLL